MDLYSNQWPTVQNILLDWKQRFNVSLLTPAAIFLLAYLLMDLGFIVLHCLKWAGILDNPGFFVNTERGYGEIFQYSKYGMGVILGISMLLSKRDAIYVAMACTMGYLLIDDSAGIHEHTDNWFRHLIDIPAVGPLASADVWQVLTLAISALLLALIWFWALKRTNSQPVRLAAYSMLCWFFLFGCFAAGMDAAHALFRGSVFDHLFGLIEDGGEMITISFALGIQISDMLARLKPNVYGYNF